MPVNMKTHPFAGVDIMMSPPPTSNPNSTGPPNTNNNTGIISSGNSTTNNHGQNGANTEDLTTLEAEITELQRENARVESQMMRLKSDINAMESHLTHGDRVRNTTGWLKDIEGIGFFNFFCKLI